MFTVLFTMKTNSESILGFYNSLPDMSLSETIFWVLLLALWTKICHILLVLPLFKIRLKQKLVICSFKKQLWTVYFEHISILTFAN